MTPTRWTAVAFAVGRLAFGAALVAAPGRTASGWLGDDSARPGTKVAVRGLGARDLALSAGVLAAAPGGDLRPWLAACVGCDLSDIAATLAAGDALPERARIGTVALAGAAAAAGGALLAAVSR